LQTRPAKGATCSHRGTETQSSLTAGISKVSPLRLCGKDGVAPIPVIALHGQLCYTQALMNQPPLEKLDVHSEVFLHSLMRRQLRLSIISAATFLSALLGLPLANYFFPEFMAQRVFGFTLTWFVLGVLFFPFVWIISWLFIKRSIALEEAEAAEIEREKRGKGEEEKASL
jgi:uncharacterized membrane protein (DUF485 family)